MTPEERPHGLSRYKHGPGERGTEGKGCRCATCRKAAADYERHRYRMLAYGRWQSSFTDATGTHRRIQALMRCGWSIAELAARLGISRNALRLKLNRAEMVAAVSAAAVRDLYDGLWDQAPPSGTADMRRAATRARNYARKRGWVPPAAWDDDAIDNPDAAPVDGWQRGEGRERGLLVAEALDLFGFGLDEREAAERLGVARGTLSAALSRARAKEGDVAA